MLKRTTITTKPSPDVQWNKLLTPEIINHISTNWVQTGKLLAMVNTFKHDGITQVSETAWASQEDLAAYESDEVLTQWFTDLAKYRADNGITVSEPVIIEIEHNDPFLSNHIFEMKLITESGAPISETEFMSDSA